MSRIDDGDINDTASFLASCALEHNMKQALKGKKGQKFLRELEAELVAMPEKRLWRGTLAQIPVYRPYFKIEGEVCALGVVAVARAMKEGKSRDRAIFEVSKIAPAEDDQTSNWRKIRKAADALGISMALAYAIVYQNDECGWESRRDPEANHTRMLEWVRSRIIKETA